MSGTSGPEKMEIDITQRLDDSAKPELAKFPQRAVYASVRLAVVSFHFAAPDFVSDCFQNFFNSVSKTIVKRYLELAIVVGKQTKRNRLS